MSVKNQVTAFIAEVISSSIGEAFQPRLEYAREEKFGDYACNVAMDKDFRALASRKNPAWNNPKKLGEDLLQQMTAHPSYSSILAKAEIAGPGFINLFVSDDLLSTYSSQALQSPDVYGRNKEKSKRNIVFEFVSANPTGPLNIVSARAAALGDSCSNLLDWAGHKVSREYYVNDTGNQVGLLGWSVFFRYLETLGAVLVFAQKDSKGEAVYPNNPGIRFPSEGYHGEYLKEMSVEVSKKVSPNRFDLKSIVEKAKKNQLAIDDLSDFLSLAEEFGQQTVAQFLSTHKRDLEKFRVKFDKFFSEKSLHDAGKVMSVRDKIKDYIFKEDGKEFFRSSEFGDEKDRVIVRDDGRPTYLLADIAYHYTKVERKFNEIINIWGPDHHGYIKRLHGALQAMGFPKEEFQVLIAQQVNLFENGQPVVMSKRAGKLVTLETLIEEIPIDVSRYFFVMRAFESHLDFDLVEAQDTSDKNPYFYVAYAHARIQSIKRKCEERGISVGKDFSQLETTPERRRLMWMVARFPEEVADAAATLEPHRLINYLYSLASSLSKFYGKPENKVIGQESEVASQLLRILITVGICLKNGLGILGMNAPDRLDRIEATESAEILD